MRVFTYYREYRDAQFNERIGRLQAAWWALTYDFVFPEFAAENRRERRERGV